MKGKRKRNSSYPIMLDNTKYEYKPKTSFDSYGVTNSNFLKNKNISGYIRKPDSIFLVNFVLFFKLN